MSRVQLRLASREFEGFERSFGAQIGAFERLNPGIEIKAEFYDLAAHHKRLIEDRGAAQGEADLFLCVTDWLPEAIDAGLLQPIDAYLEQEPPEDWPNGWSPSMLELQKGEDGRVYGLPYHDGPEIFMYRADLFEDEREQEVFRNRFGFELGSPETWTQFIDVARFFTRPSDGLWGACLAGFPDAHNNIYDFMIHLWSRGGRLLGPKGEPLFAGAEGVGALQFLVDLYHKHCVVSPECLKLDSVASGLYYAAGNAAMMWNWSGFAAVAENPDLSKIVGRTKTTLMPRDGGLRGRSVSLNIYWVLCIAIGSRHKEEAYRFMRHVASKEMDKATSMLGGNGTRLSTWRDAEVRKSFPYYAIIEEIHREVASPPKIAAFPIIAESLNHMVDDVLNQRMEVLPALDRAAKEVQELWAK